MRQLSPGRRLGLGGTPFVGLAVVILQVAVAGAQTTQPGLQPIDACGVLVRGTECVLFEGGGGRYVLSNAGDYRVGDLVRVVGTVDPDCITICQEGDGCIRGAVVYDPTVYPCGTPIPSLPGDLVTGLCTATSGALAGLAVGGLCLSACRAPRKTRLGE